MQRFRNKILVVVATIIIYIFLSDLLQGGMTEYWLRNKSQLAGIGLDWNILICSHSYCTGSQSDVIGAMMQVQWFTAATFVVHSPQ